VNQIVYYFDQYEQKNLVYKNRTVQTMGILNPIRDFINTKISRYNKSSNNINDKKIREKLDEFEKNGDLSDLERRMMISVLELEDITVREIIVPQPDINSIPADMGISEISQYISDKPHTRYPVINESGDQIIGFIDIKDIISLQNSKNSNISASDIARDIPIYPDTTPVDQILVSLQEDNKQIAAVIDEWGSLEGIITIEDIVEVIVGDIYDEFDDPEKDPKIRKAGEFYEVDGNVPIKRINKVLGTEFRASNGIDTIAGLLLSNIGEVPDVGEKTQIDNILFEVTNVNDNRILNIKLQRVENNEV
jgi:CBS domain containing-hemolysin-like protein